MKKRTKKTWTMPMTTTILVRKKRKTRVTTLKVKVTWWLKNLTVSLTGRGRRRKMMMTTMMMMKSSMHSCCARGGVCCGCAWWTWKNLSVLTSVLLTRGLLHLSLSFALEAPCLKERVRMTLSST